MKMIKKTSLILFLTSMFFTSCNLKKENTSVFDDNPRIESVKLNNGDEVIVRKDYYGTYSFNDWNTYNLANIEIHRIEAIDYKTTRGRLLNLNDEITNLDKNMPNWLKTTNVLEDIREVKEEYSKLIEAQNEPMKNVKQNWEDFEEKFEDLREALDETIKQYNA